MMINIEQDLTVKEGINKEIFILDEYNAVIEELKQELHLCKAEQNNLRSEVAVLRNEKNCTEDIRDAFKHIHSEECNEQDIYQKKVANLQERIALLQAEKESVLQLWHISLNTIDVLEEELKAFRVNGKGTKFYQEQTNTIKETYSEAIKALEGNLLQAKENFLKQQTMCQTHKEKIESLSREKDDIMRKYACLQKDIQEKDRNNQLKIETIQKELSYARAETDKLVQQKLDLERKLNDSKRVAEIMVEKDRETKLKMSEAIELIESAVREKDMVLHREGLILEEKARLELRLATIANEYDTKIEELNKKTKEEADKTTNQYISEITKLKMELAEKMAFLHKAQKELKFIEEELEKTQRSSEDATHKLQAKLQEYEQKLQHVEQENLRIKSTYDLEIMQLSQKIGTLEGKLSNSNDKLKRLELQSSPNMQDRVYSVEDERGKNVINMMEQYANLESQLAKALDNKEELPLQLKSLKQNFDREMEKRDNEKRALENKLHELEIDLQMTKSKKECNPGEIVTERPQSHLGDTKNTHSFDITVENKCYGCQTVLSDYVTKLQEKFERKNKELIHHVQVHQKLSKRWQDEAKSLTVKFQGRTKQLKAEINALQKENSELSKELNTCKQQLIQHVIEDIQKYSLTR